MGGIRNHGPYLFECGAKMNEIAGDAKEVARMMSSKQLIAWAEWIVDMLEEGNYSEEDVVQFRTTLDIVFEALEIHATNLVDKP